MAGYDTATTQYATGQSPPGDRATMTPVLAVMWCRSVGTFWTLELHQLYQGTPRTTLTDWISSGVPITQPHPPEALARKLLAERGLWLFCDSVAGPCTGTRRGIGYAAGNAELIALAHFVADYASEIERHPVMLAAQWISAGFSAEAAARWIRQGVHSPQTTRLHHSALCHRPAQPATGRPDLPGSPSIASESGFSRHRNRSRITSVL
jgi:hypothetical protein